MSEGGAEREGDTECEAGSRFWAVSTEPDTGLELTNREIMAWAEVGHLTNWATQAPREHFKFLKLLNQQAKKRITVLIEWLVPIIRWKWDSWYRKG